MAVVSDGRIDFVIFFWDPLEPQPHDVDVKALLRVAVVHNIPVACNRATADFLLSSPLLSEPYPRIVQGYVERSRSTYDASRTSTLPSGSVQYQARSTVTDSTG